MKKVVDSFSFRTGRQRIIFSNQLPESQPGFLNLNDLTFFEMSIPLMQRHKYVSLYLDKNKLELQQAQNALEQHKKYKDGSICHKGFKDCDNLLMNKSIRQDRPKIAFGVKVGENIPGCDYHSKFHLIYFT